MEWFYIAVNEVQVGEGVYDWSALESRLNEVASRGHQAYDDAFAYATLSKANGGQDWDTTWDADLYAP